MLSKSLQFAVFFARWCEEYQIDPVDAAKLITLARKVAAAGERECNIPDASADSQRKRFEVAATEFGFTVQYSGLWPSLVRGRESINIPNY
jgi:hypothetical protein